MLATPFLDIDNLQFELALDEPGYSVVTVLDASGRMQKTVAQGSYGPGRHAFRWDGRDRAGRPLASGSCIVAGRFGNEEERRPLLLVR